MTTKVSDERLGELEWNLSDVTCRCPYDPGLPGQPATLEGPFCDRCATMVSLRELQEKRALLKECEALLQVAVCPECPGVGFNVHPTMPDGEPEQVQCRWCFERDALLARVRGEI